MSGHAMQVRPLLDFEKQKGGGTCIEAPNATTVALPGRRGEAEGFTFEYDRVYKMINPGRQLFAEVVEPLLQRLLQGFNTTVGRLPHSVCCCWCAPPMQAGKGAVACCWIANRWMMWRRAPMLDTLSTSATHMKCSRSACVMRADLRVRPDRLWQDVLVRPGSHGRLHQGLACSHPMRACMPDYTVAAPLA